MNLLRARFVWVGVLAAMSAMNSVAVQPTEPKMKSMLVHSVSGGFTGRTRVVSVTETSAGLEVWRDVFANKSESKPMRVGVLKTEAANELVALLDDCPGYRAPKRDNRGADVQTHTLASDSRELSAQWFDTSADDLPPRLKKLVQWLEAIDSKIGTGG